MTVVDNLTTRLEYLPDSAQCSLNADFFTEVNEGDSLVLRWEIIDPLEVGEGAASVENADYVNSWKPKAAE